jgi:2-Cys peroxiredoxin 5
MPRRALFHSTAPAFVQKGDAIPDLDVLVESSPGNKINLAKELKGKGIIVGVPAAFSTFAAPSLEALRLISLPSDVTSMTEKDKC